jgi:PAS domain S-box-containing protein
MTQETDALRREIKELRNQNRELEETLEAIRSGEVDAIVVTKGGARQVYTLEGADHPYRALVENIREGALTLSRTGMILYTNTRFAEMVMLPPDRVPGTSLLDYACPEFRPEIEQALREITVRPCKDRIRIRHSGGSLPVLISMNPLSASSDTKISVVVTDRRSDEEQILMQARMLEAVGDAVIGVDTDQRIIYWNPAATRDYGWKPEEVLDRQFWEVAVPEELKTDAHEILDQIKRGVTWSGSYIVRHRDGHLFPVHGNISPIFDDDGKLIAIIGASHDVSEQKRKEEILRYHANLVETISDAIISTDKELRIQSWNPGAEHMYGWHEDEVMGRKGPDILRTEFLEGTSREALTQKLFGAGSWRGEVIQRTKDGRQINVEATSISIRNENGDVIGGVSVGRDITDRKRAEEELAQKNQVLRELNDELINTAKDLETSIGELADTERSLRETQEYLESLITYANAPIIVWDQDLRIVRLNRALVRLTGREPGELVGRPIHELFPPGGREKSIDLITRATKGERWEAEEIPIQSVDGSTRTVLWNSAPIYSPNELILVSTIAQGVDITRMKQHEVELTKLTDDLRRSNKELEQFAYVASHDLREPLRMVTLFSQLLQKNYGGRLDPDADEFIGYIVEGAIRMDSLVNDLLEYSRVSSQGRPFQPTDFKSVIQEVRTNLAVAIMESGAVLDVRSLPTIDADRSQIVQLYQNLISNAIKFRRDQAPHITIAMEEDKQEWMFSVQDNGIGIEEEYTAKIFNIFQRLHSKDQYAGTGIGLAICRRIVERHGGKIWVESDPGQGSTFRFTIPKNAP